MSTAVVTASYAADFERCRLLCESMDTRLKGDWTHYILVASFDVGVFRALEGPRRQVVSERDLLPSWLRAVPDPVSGGRRKLWISPFGLPLRGWHVQQLRRFSLSRHLTEKTMFSIDSDVVLLRDFDPASLWQDGKLALYRRPAGIQPVMPSNHLEWLSHSDRLLGIGPYRLPADDYINTLIGWRSDTCRALLDYIESRHGCGWVRAMIRSRQFSECLIYGRFVDEVLGGEGHFATSDALCHVLWQKDSHARDAEGLKHFLADMKPYQIGIGVQSFIGHDLADIRELALGKAA